MNVPLVRNEHGAVLGADYRRTTLSRVQVPGKVAAGHVMPGDTIRREGLRLVVHAVRTIRDRRYCISRTTGGAEIVIELTDELVHVVAVGAFDRVGPTQ